MNELEELRLENAYLKAELERITLERDELQAKLNEITTEAVEDWFERGFY